MGLGKESGIRENKIIWEFVGSCGEDHKGCPLAFGLADSPSTRYAIVVALHEVRKCHNESLCRVLVAKVLFYAFDGNQIINTPVSQCLVLYRLNKSFIRIDKTVMSFCYIVSKGTLPQELRDLEFEYDDVKTWENE